MLQVLRFCKNRDIRFYIACAPVNFALRVCDVNISAAVNTNRGSFYIISTTFNVVNYQSPFFDYFWEAAHKIFYVRHGDKIIQFL